MIHCFIVSLNCSFSVAHKTCMTLLSTCRTFGKLLVKVFILLQIIITICILILMASYSYLLSRCCHATDHSTGRGLKSLKMILLPCRLEKREYEMSFQSTKVKLIHQKLLNLFLWQKVLRNFSGVMLCKEYRLMKVLSA